MTREEILQSFGRTLRDVLGEEDAIALTMETRREDVPGWDSFAYIAFIAAIELELGVKFRVADVESFETVGAMVRETERRLADRQSRQAAKDGRP